MSQALAAGSRARDGAVLSIFTVTVVAVLTLPARSVQVPEAAVPPVSAVNVWSAEQAAPPLPPLSPAGANETVTSSLFHPSALAGGVRVAMGGLGAVLSIFTVTSVAVLVFPALSVQVPDTVCPGVSAVSVVAAVQDATSTPLGPTSPAEVNDTVTSVLFHPLAFGAGDGVAVGGLGRRRVALDGDGLAGGAATARRRARERLAGRIAVTVLGPQPVDRRDRRVRASVDRPTSARRRWYTSR